MAGDEARVSNVCQCSWSNIAWVAMWLGLLYTLCVITEGGGVILNKLTKKPCVCKPYFQISNFFLHRRVL